MTYSIATCHVKFEFKKESFLDFPRDPWSKLVCFFVIVLLFIRFLTFNFSPKQPIIGRSNLPKNQNYVIVFALVVAITKLNFGQFSIQIYQVNLDPNRDFMEISKI